MAGVAPANNFAAFPTISENFAAAATQDQGNFISPVSQASVLRNGIITSQFWTPQQIPNAFGTSPIAINFQLTPGSYGGIDFIAKDGMFIEFTVSNTGNTGASAQFVPSIGAFSYIQEYFSQNSLVMSYFPEATNLENYLSSDYYKLLNIALPENLNAGPTATFLASGAGLTGGLSQTYICRIQEPLSRGKVCVSALQSNFTVQAYQAPATEFCTNYSGSGAALSITSMRLHALGFQFAPAVKNQLLAIYARNKVISSYYYPRQFVTAIGSVTSASTQTINFGLSQAGTAGALWIMPRATGATGIARYTPINCILNMTYFVSGTIFGLESNEAMLLMNNEYAPRWYPGGIMSVYNIVNIPWCTDPYVNIPEGRLTGSHYSSVLDSLQFKAPTGFSTTSCEALCVLWQQTNLIQQGGMLDILLL